MLSRIVCIIPWISNTDNKSLKSNGTYSQIFFFFYTSSYGSHYKLHCWGKAELKACRMDPLLNQELKAKSTCCLNCHDWKIRACIEQKKTFSSLKGSTSMPPNRKEYIYKVTWVILSPIRPLGSEVGRQKGKKRISHWSWGFTRMVGA